MRRIDCMHPRCTGSHSWGGRNEDRCPAAQERKRAHALDPCVKEQRNERDRKRWARDSSMRWGQYIRTNDWKNQKDQRRIDAGT